MRVSLVYRHDLKWLYIRPSIMHSECLSLYLLTFCFCRNQMKKDSQLQSSELHVVRWHVLARRWLIRYAVLYENKLLCWWELNWVFSCPSWQMSKLFKVVEWVCSVHILAHTYVQTSFIWLTYPDERLRGSNVTFGYRQVPPNTN